MTEERLPDWLKRRHGESRDEWLTRTARSCYWCPHPTFRNYKEADEHELQCARRTREQRDALLAREIRGRR